MSFPVRAAPRARPIPATIRAAAVAILGAGVTDRVVAAAMNAAHAIATIAARAPLQPTGHRVRSDPIDPIDPTVALPAPVPIEATGATAPGEANGGIEPIARVAGIVSAAAIAWPVLIGIAIGIAWAVPIGISASGQSNRVPRR